MIYLYISKIRNSSLAQLVEQRTVLFIRYSVCRWFKPSKRSHIKKPEHIVRAFFYLKFMIYLYISKIRNSSLAQLVE